MNSVSPRSDSKSCQFSSICQFSPTTAPVRPGKSQLHQPSAVILARSRTRVVDGRAEPAVRSLPCGACRAEPAVGAPPVCRNFRADGLVARWDEAVLALKDSRRTRAVKVLLEPARLSLCLGF